MYTEKYQLIVPTRLAVTEALATTSGDHDKVEVYSGNRAVKNYGVSVVGSGSWAKGTIDGSLDTYDYKALYQIYTLKDSESANYWFVSYSKQTSHDEVKKVAEQSETLRTNYKLEFEIQGNDYGINAVFITFEVIRVVYSGITKDFVVSNPASSQAITPDGNPYPGGFKPIG